MGIAHIYHQLMELEELLLNLRANLNYEWYEDPQNPQITDLRNSSLSMCDDVKYMLSIIEDIEE